MQLGEVRALEAEHDPERREALVKRLFAELTNEELARELAGRLAATVWRNGDHEMGVNLFFSEENAAHAGSGLTRIWACEGTDPMCDHDALIEAVDYGSRGTWSMVEPGFVLRTFGDFCDQLEASGAHIVSREPEMSRVRIQRDGFDFVASYAGRWVSIYSPCGAELWFSLAGNPIDWEKVYREDWRIESA